MFGMKMGQPTPPAGGSSDRPGKPNWKQTAALGVLSLCTLLLAVSSPAAVRADELDDKGDTFIKQKRIKLPPQNLVSAIVQIDGDFTVDKATQVKLLGSSIYTRLPLINAVAVRLPAGQLLNLAKLPFVKRLSEDVVMTKTDEFTVGSSGADVAFQQYNATGSGIRVAVLDSGYHPHPDLTTAAGDSRVVANVSFVNDNAGTDDPCGHGTHVMGIVAGNGAASTGSPFFKTFYGIARSADIVNVRVLGQDGTATVSTVISGIQWCIANKATYNIRVMNLSLGHGVGESYTTDPLCQAVENAWKGGIVVVCAAGNGGRQNASITPGQDNEGYGTAYGSIGSPGNDPYVITVGAMKTVDGTRAHDTIATYSSRGPTMQDLVLKPDIVAAGNQVISLRSPNSALDVAYGSTNALPFSFYSNLAPGGDPMYFKLSGTSMACPVVSGAAALLLDKDPSLTPDTIKARLMVSADKWSFPDGTCDPCTFGAGYLNIPAALDCTATATQSALSPTLVQDEAGNVCLNNVIWGSNVIWGTGITNLNVIWGSNVIWGNNIIWGSNVIWGNNIIWGSNIIWGNNIIWGSNIIWGVDVNIADTSTIAAQGDKK